MAYDFLQRRAHVIKAQATASRYDHGGKFFLCDNVQVEMQDKFARIGMQMVQCVGGRCRGSLCLYICGMYVTQRSAREKILLWRIEPRQTEQRDVGLAHQWRLAPEAHQLRCALADDMREHHAVDSARRRRCRSIQVGIAVE